MPRTPPQPEGLGGGSMKRLYTDIDPFCCEVLRARVADGGLLPGEVWERDVATLTAGELRPFTQVHLFCGIGASPLGLRWAGWPDDESIVTGGFPCQDISAAGKGAGLEGKRSGLFWEMLRVVDTVRPSWVLAENVAALSARGLDRVVGALGETGGGGYDVAALRVGAWAVGAPHQRERWWIVARRVANPHESERGGRGVSAGQGRPDEAAVDAGGRGVGERGSARREVADAERDGRGAGRGVEGDKEGAGGGRREPARSDESSAGVADAHGGGWGEHEQGRGSAGGTAAGRAGAAVVHAAEPGLEGHQRQAGQQEEPEPRYAVPCRWPMPPGPEQWHWEPPRIFQRVDQRGMGDGADGLPARVAAHIRGVSGFSDAQAEKWWKRNRVKMGPAMNKLGVAALGNAQVPQCVMLIARAMMESAQR